MGGSWEYYNRYFAALVRRMVMLGIFDLQKNPRSAAFANGALHGALVVIIAWVIF